MKFYAVIFFAFVSLNFFGQTPNSTTRINGQPLNSVSPDPNNPDNVIISSAVPLVGERSLTSQSGNLVLNPVSEKVKQPSDSSQAAAARIKESNAIALPATKYSTSQAATLKLVPIETQDKKPNTTK